MSTSTWALEVPKPITQYVPKPQLVMEKDGYRAILTEGMFVKKGYNLHILSLPKNERYIAYHEYMYPQGEGVSAPGFTICIWVSDGVEALEKATQIFDEFLKFKNKMENIAGLAKDAEDRDYSQRFPKELQ